MVPSACVPLLDLDKRGLRPAPVYWHTPYLQGSVSPAVALAPGGDGVRYRYWSADPRRDKDPLHDRYFVGKDFGVPHR